MMMAYRYIRYSTDGQSDGDSVRRQDALAKAYASAHGLILADEAVIDAGVSAFRGANAETGELRRFLARVQDQSVARGSILLVESLDRLTRQQSVPSLTLLFEIVKSGLKVVTLDDNKLYDDNISFIDVIYSAVKMERSHDESKIKSLRGKAAWIEKRQKVSDRLYTAKTPSWIKSDGKTLTLYPEKASTILDIFEKASNGWGAYSIASNLNERRVATFGRSALWGTSYVKRILKSEAVFGRLRFLPDRDGNDHGFKDNYYPPVISKDRFFEVQSCIRERRRTGGGRTGSNVSNIFSKIVVCGYCDAPMHYINKGKSPKGGSYLACSSGIRSGGCTRRHWRYSEVERLILEEIVDLAPHEGLEDAAATEKTSINQRISSVSAQIDENNERLHNLTRVAEKTSESIEEIVRSLNDAQSQKRRLADELMKLKTEAREIGALANEMNNSRRDIVSKLEFISAVNPNKHADIRRSIRSNVKKIIYKIVSFHDPQIDKFKLNSHLDALGDSGGVPFLIILLRDRTSQFLARTNEGKILRLRYYDENEFAPNVFKTGSVGMPSDWFDWNK